MSETKEITYFRGDSYPREITITDADTGAVVDVSGYTITLVVDSLQSPATPSTSEKFTVVGDVTDAAVGKILFTPTSDNNDIAIGDYFYFIKMTAGEVKRTIIKDKYIIT